MINADPTSLELLTKSRPTKVANGLTGVVFREILGVGLNDEVFMHSPRLQGLTWDGLAVERMPFSNSARAERLLGMLGLVFKGKDFPWPPGAACFLTGEIANPNERPEFSVHSPVGVNSLREGVLYLAQLEKDTLGRLPIIGTNNPTQGMYVSESSICLVKSGEVLHAHDAISLVEVRAQSN